MSLNRSLALLALISLLALGLIGCASDDPTDPGGGGTVDTTAPTVLGVDPSDSDTDVGQDAEITINFSEAMDQATAEANIFISSGSITGFNWTSDSSVRVTHPVWAEGVQVTVTVGAGITDVAGNSMDAAYVFSFYVFSSILQVLETNPGAGTTDVNRATNIQILFSTQMIEASVQANTSVTSDAGQTDHPYTMTTDDSAVTLNLTDPLPASTLISVRIDVGVAATNGTTLEATYIFIFTTGLDVDTTPPTILSFSPTSGSTIDPNSGTLQITFSEPMDPITFSPTAMNVEFAALVGASTPVWTDNYTVLTVTMPTPMPAGLPMELTFAEFADANGVVQTTPWNWQATVAGTPDYFPLIDGKQFVFGIYAEGGNAGNNNPTWSEQWTAYYQVETQLDGSARVTEYDPNFTAPNGEGYELYKKTNSEVQWLGFREIDTGSAEIRFSNPMTYLPLPLSAGTWNSSTTLTIPGEGTLAAELSGTVIGQFDVPVDAGGGDDLFFKDTWKVVRHIEVSAGGVMVEVISDTTSYAVGFGPVFNSEFDDMIADGEWSDWNQWQIIDNLK